MSCEDIPSLLDLQKVKKHADDFGRLMGTGTGTSTNGVTGQTRPTFNAVMANLGYTRVGTFASGGTLLNGRQTLLWDVADGGDGQEYGWSGAFPPAGKVVPSGSTPLTTGGISVGAWMSRFDPELHIQVREVQRRSYAEVGYNLVDGSFEAGGTLVNVNDVLLQERTGKAFSGPAGAVAAGTDPTSGGFIDRSDSLGVCIGDVDAIASGVFPVGAKVVTTDRAGAKFTIVAGGTPNGYDIINAGNNNTAVLDLYESIENLGAIADDQSQSAIENNTSAVSIALDKYNLVIGAGNLKTYYLNNASFTPKTDMVWKNGIFRSLNDAAGVNWFVNTGEKIRGVNLEDVRFYGDGTLNRSFINTGIADTNAWVNLTIRGRVYLGGFKTGLGIVTWTCTIDFLRVENCQCPYWFIGTSIDTSSIYVIGAPRIGGIGLAWDDITNNWNETNFGVGLSYCNFGSFANDQVSTDGLVIGRVNGTVIGSFGCESELSSGWTYRLISNSRGAITINSGTYFEGVPLFKDETTNGKFIVSFNGELREANRLFTDDSTRNASVVMGVACTVDSEIFTLAARQSHETLVSRPVSAAVHCLNYAARARKVTGLPQPATVRVNIFDGDAVWNNGEEFFIVTGPMYLGDGQLSSHRLRASVVHLEISTLYDGGDATKRLNGSCIITATELNPNMTSPTAAEIINTGGNLDGNKIGVTKTYDQTTGDMKLSIRCRLGASTGDTAIYYARFRSIGGDLRGVTRIGLKE